MKRSYVVFLGCCCVVFTGNQMSVASCQGCSCVGGCCTPSVPKKTPVNKRKPVDTQKEAIKQAYGQVAKVGGFCGCAGGGCCGGGASLSQDIGYTLEQLKNVPEANLGLGCGNPISLGDIRAGDVVVDLGSGAGMDCFLASKKVGPTGKVIGIDMTPEMLEKARVNAKKYGFTNVEFRQGDIEKLPVASNSVDIVMSNCVINLATNKFDVFKEAYRVLKSGGKMYVSDVVLLGALTLEQKADQKLLCACVSGALPKDECIRMLESVGFTVKIVDEDAQICKKWFENTTLPIASLKYVATK